VEFVNHIDELYLADLSEKSNDNDSRLSMIFAAASLTLTILILPSFWADIGQIVEPRLSGHYDSLLPFIETLGDGLAVILVASALFLFYVAILQGKQFKDALKKLIANRSNLHRQLKSKRVV